MRERQISNSFSASELAGYDQELSGIVKESRNGSSRTFTSDRSIFDHYERTLNPVSDTQWREDIRFTLYIPAISWLLAIGVKHQFGTFHKRNRYPFWHPPTQLDAETLRTVWALIGMSFLNSYYATLLGQLLTFIASEFRNTTAAQGIVLGVSRLDILPAMVLLILADRIGRKKIILFSTAAGAIFSALGSIVPNIYFLAADQIAAKACATASILLISIISSEKVPSNARAWSLAALVIGSASGAGVAAAMLPLAGLSSGSWRILFAVSILALFAIKPFSRHIKESQRFEVLTHEPRQEPRIARSRKNRNALILLSVSTFLLNVFYIPASQFRNEFLSHDRGFSAGAIGIFTIVTAAPGGIGLALSGRLSETRGRRFVTAAALVLGTGGLMLGFLSHGIWIWVWALLGSIIAPGVIPALGVYLTELFPTRYRGTANGIIGIWARLGSIAGVLAVGFLGSTLYNQVGTPLALMGLGPLLLAILVVVRFPETKGLQLETINPEDSAFHED